MTATDVPALDPDRSSESDRDRDRDRDPGLGRVEAIHVTDAGSRPMRAVERVRAMAGIGLEGDRYARGTGHYSDKPKVDRQITLIEAEEIEALEAGSGIRLAPGESRRNVTTRGIRLNELVGRRFRIGGVECEGTRLCEPCQYLTDLLGKPVLGPLVHRAGLRARILTDGEIALGDEVIALD
ncbi:MAG TPA: MOSC domain-containing protein [Candidatus Limnocylindrales bacterium]|nr:MOSC domain-containing protein [Candidatus Limnocylindrales bacterium]